MSRKQATRERKRRMAFWDQDGTDELMAVGLFRAHRTFTWLVLVSRIIIIKREQQLKCTIRKWLAMVFAPRKGGAF